MAFGHAVKRHGFDEKLKNVNDLYVADDSGDTSDQQIKGTNGGDFIDGAGGDDVIIGFGGADTLIGGDGEDDLSGGGGGDQDTLVGGILDGDVGSEVFTQDDYSDDYNAAETFEENGTDLIRGYDADPTDFEASGVVDVIDFSESIDFVDPTDDGEPTTDAEKEAQLDAMLSYNSTTGDLSDASANVWFNVTSDYGGTTAASTVYVEVDGDVFQWTGTNWDLQQDWDIV